MMNSTTLYLMQSSNMISRFIRPWCNFQLHLNNQIEFVIQKYFRVFYTKSREWRTILRLFLPPEFSRPEYV